MKSITAFLAAWVLLSSALFAAQTRPNIILIMADDLGIEGLGCYGGESYSTPNLDRLAAEGVQFTHAYAQPLCTPTRVQIMTGKYNHRNWQVFGILDPAEKTFGHFMHQAGYKTCIAGKWQLQSYDPPDYPGAEKRRGTGMHSKDAGFDEYMLYHALHTEDKGSRYANPTFLRNGELHRNVEGAYGEDLNVEFIADFLRRYRDEPMFVYYPMALPHWPFNPTPISEAWNDPERRLEEGTEHFPDMVAYMDRVVGRLLDHLTDLKLAEDTVVIFYSDNGTDRRVLSRFGGDWVQGGKGETSQTGIRVPLIVRWPEKIQAGTTSDALVDATDFFPTLAELAGRDLELASGVEGHSFVPAMLGQPSGGRQWCYFWYDPRPGWDKERFTRSIFALDHDYKLFSDGRFFSIAGKGFQEQRLTQPLDARALAGREKLQRVLDRMMAPPLSSAALRDPDEFGKP